jgi:hypothetical protein
LQIGFTQTNKGDRENMKNLLKYSTLAVVFALVGSTAAFAVPAPEVDPSMGVAGVALLAGALTVLRGRRSK